MHKAFIIVDERVKAVDKVVIGREPVCNGVTQANTRNGADSTVNVYVGIREIRIPDRNPGLKLYPARKFTEFYGKTLAYGKIVQEVSLAEGRLPSAGRRTGRIGLNGGIVTYGTIFGYAPGEIAPVEAYIEPDITGFGSILEEPQLDVIHRKGVHLNGNVLRRNGILVPRGRVNTLVLVVIRYKTTKPHTIEPVEQTP